MFKFVGKSSILCAAFLCIAFFSLALFSVSGFDWKNLKYTGATITSDEFAHISAGYYYLKTGRYLLNPEHPPLVKDIAAIPLFLVNPYIPRIGVINKSSREIGHVFGDEKYPFENEIFSSESEMANDEWGFGNAFLFNQRNDPDTIVLYSRIGVILFNTIFFIYIFLFSFGIMESESFIVFDIFHCLFSIQYCPWFIGDNGFHVFNIANDSIIFFCYLSKKICGE